MPKTDYLNTLKSSQTKAIEDAYAHEQEKQRKLKEKLT